MIYIFFIALNLLIIKNFDLIKNSIKIYDYPDLKRKFHKKPTFIGGGIIIFINFIFIILFGIIFDKEYIIKLNENPKYFTWVIGPILIFFLGIYDDKKNLSGNIKFLILSVIYLIIIYIDKSLVLKNLEFSSNSYILNLGIFSFIFSYLCLMIFSNAFNMLDGMNLQVGIYTIIIFIFFIFKFGLKIDLILIMLSIFTYLYLNFKQKTFLGDSGTYLLSYIIAILFIENYNSNRSFLCDEIFMIMILPGLELIRLFSTRALNRKNPLSADRTHIHHLLQIKFKNYNFIKLSILTNSIYFVFCFSFLMFKNIMIILLSILFYIIAIKSLSKN